MLCPECKHPNPEPNRFCGMCGSRLRWSNAESYTPDIAPEPLEPLVSLPQQFLGPRSTETTGQQPPEERPLQGGYGEYTDALLADLTPAESGTPAYDPNPAQPNRRLWAESAEPAEPVGSGFEQLFQEHEEEQQPPISIGGPSFLGLGEVPTGGRSNSYLLDEEPEGSGHGWIVALVMLLVVGAAVVALGQNWHGSRDWALTRSTLLAEKVRDWRSGSAPLPENGQQTASQPMNESGTSSAASESGISSSTSVPNGAVAPNGSQETAPGQTAQQQPSPDSKATETGPEKSAEAQAGAGPTITVDNDKSGGKDNVAGQNPEYQAATQAPSASSNAKQETGKIAEPKPKPPAAAKSAAPALKTQSKPATPQEQKGDELVTQGERFLYGEGVRRDCNQAMVYFRAGAEQQNPKALSRMGALYATGTCVPMNRVVAYNWFTRALAQDSKNPLLEENLNMLWRDMSSSERNQVLQPKAR